MKRTISIAVILLLMASVGQKSMAQSLKFGHINTDELMQAMPEFDTAQVKFEKYGKELQNALELMSVELNNKNEAYQKESKNYSEIVKQTKEQELIDMNKRIQDFQNNAQSQLQSKQAELFQPIYQKVDKAIKDVGKENGFFYVFDVAKGVLLYFDETKSTNVTPLVKAKLGMK
jgi:outer membrane protein